MQESIQQACAALRGGGGDGDDDGVNGNGNDGGNGNGGDNGNGNGSVGVDGGVVLHPTETCYGFACDATNPRAVEKLYRLKKMSSDKPCSVMVGSYEEAIHFGEFSGVAGVLAQQYWPGPLTLIVQRTDLASKLMRGIMFQSFLGIRVPGHEWTLALLREYKKPLITTSANVHGQPECYDVECVFKQLNFDNVKNFGNVQDIKNAENFEGFHNAENFKNFENIKNAASRMPDFVLDQGVLFDRQKPSTIIKVSGKKLLLVREGPLGKEILEKYFHYFKN